MRRGKLSKVEQFYIQSNKNMPVEELAGDLDRSTTVVQKFLDKIVVPEKPTVAVSERKETPSKRGPAYTNFAHQTQSGNDTPGITINTAAASAAADEWGKTQQRGTPNKYKQYVGKVHSDKPSETN